MRRIGLLLLLAALPALAATRNNDDSCDIGVAPAATLLVPLFEVDLAAPATSARTTLFSITNVSHQPQIARVTLWTDWAYPLFAFNVFLTGYDVQSINLYDVLARGVVAQTSNAMPSGAMSSSANPRFLSTAATNCSTSRMPSEIPYSLLTDLQTALTTGAFSACGTHRIGGSHALAIGYATIDVVADCTFRTPAERAYHERELLFDNVLVGDYQIVGPGQNYAQAEAMVHIRAIPEGSAAATNLPFTFYDRYATKGADRRQPLPSVFVARYLQGGGSGFATHFKVWREGVVGADATCAEYAKNGSFDASEYVRFDSRENPTTAMPTQIILWVPVAPKTPVAFRIASSHTSFPPLTSGDTGGWMYINLHRPDNPRAQQAWIAISMSAEGRYASEIHAVPLGNGCSPPAAMPTTTRAGGNPIAPRP